MRPEREMGWAAAPPRPPARAGSPRRSSRRPPRRCRTTRRAIAGAALARLRPERSSRSRQELVQQGMKVMHSVLSLRRVAPAVVHSGAQVALDRLADGDVLVLDLVAERQELRPRRIV